MALVLGSIGKAIAGAVGNAVAKSSGSASSGGGTSSGGNTSKGTTASSGGTYNIGSTTGQLVADGLQTGQTFTASDGSVWKKNADGSISVTEKSGKVTANAYQSTSQAAQQQPIPTNYYTEDINAMLEQKYAQAQAEALAQSQYAVEQGTSDIRAQLQQQLPSYQSMREQSAANTQTDLDNLALRSALQGNRGGIGERQYGVLQAAGQDRLLQINLEQKNLENTAAKQIADLEAQGRFQDAQTVARLAQAKISELITEAQNLRNINIQQEQFNKNFGLQEANLTGYYNGQRTLSGQQFDFGKDTTIADLLGVYNGQQTLAGKQLDFQMSEAKFDRAMQLISGGLSDEQIAADLGISVSQANQLRNNIIATNKPKSSGGGTGSTPSPTTGLETIYEKIKASGHTPESWLSYYGAQYGIKTTQSISNVLLGYEDWLDSQVATTPSTKPPAAPDTSNPNIVNNNSANNWINIGGVRYSISEVENMIDKGKVSLRQLASGKYEYYFK